MSYLTTDATDGNYLVINGVRYPVINSSVEFDNTPERRKLWRIVTEGQENAGPARVWSVRVPVPYEEGYDIGLYATEAAAQERAAMPDVQRIGHEPQVTDEPVWPTATSDPSSRTDAAPERPGCGPECQHGTTSPPEDGGPGFMFTPPPGFRPSGGAL